MKYAIVTPYYQEPRSQLERCIKSVASQTVQTDHIMVADGHPQAWINNTAVRHICLDRSHGDYGNTPRGIGSLMVIAEQYDGFGLLDADNWLENDHVEVCTALINRDNSSEKIDYVIAKRHLRRPDESIIPVADEPAVEHVDTNCFFFFPSAYHIVPYFGTMPKELAPVCDRIFYMAVRNRGLRAAFTNSATVNYECLWEVIYQAIGEDPPKGAKPNIDGASVQAWINSRTPEQLELMQKLSGVIP